MDDEPKEETLRLEKAFFSNDRPHSRPKRLILRNLLGAIFPYYWQSCRATRLRLDAAVKFCAQILRANKVGEDSLQQLQDIIKPDHSANLYYLDAFSGRGRYNDDARQELDDDLSDWGSPIIAVAKAIKALNGWCLGEDEFRKRFARNYAVFFMFNEKDGDNLECLKGLVDERFLLHGWRLIEQNRTESGLEESVVYEGDVTLKRSNKAKMMAMAMANEDESDIVMKAKIRVQYFNQEFENLPLEAIPSPLFSFIDPFGIAQIPMSAVEKLIGEDREVFINLMVATVNRNAHRLSQPGTAVSRLYDCLIPKEMIPFGKDANNTMVEPVNKNRMALCEKIPETQMGEIVTDSETVKPAVQAEKALVEHEAENSPVEPEERTPQEQRKMTASAEEEAVVRKREKMTPIEIEAQSTEDLAKRLDWMAETYFHKLDEKFRFMEAGKDRRRMMGCGETDFEADENEMANNGTFENDVVENEAMVNDAEEKGAEENEAGENGLAGNGEMENRSENGAADNENVDAQCPWWPDGYMRVKFAIKKGTSAPNKGLLYYMGFASAKLNFIHMAKQAMMKVTDLPEELCFSAFHRKDGKVIAYERKSDNEFEATTLFKIFEGLTMKLGEVKKRILLDTPFVYHSRALTVLEDTLKIIDVDTQGETRRKGNFRAHVSMYSTQPDGDEEYQKYGNNWKITFADDALGNHTQAFLSNPLDQASTQLLAYWILAKLQAIGVPQTADELVKRIPNKINDAVKSAKKLFNETNEGGEKEKRSFNSILKDALMWLAEKGVLEQIEMRPEVEENPGPSTKKKRRASGPVKYQLVPGATL